MATKKKAYRRVVRKANGIGLRVAYIDAETGQEVTDLSNYEIIDGGDTGQVVPTPSTPATPSGGGGGGGGYDSSNSPAEPFDWNAFQNRPGASRGTGNLIEDLKKTFSDVKGGLLDAKQTAINAGMDALGIPTTTSPVGRMPEYEDVQKFRTDSGVPDTKSALTKPERDTPNEMEVAATPTVQDNFLTYGDIAVRKLPVSDNYIETLAAALYSVDPNLAVVVTSAGQPKEGVEGKDRQGSHRHDVDETGHSNTADFYITRNGERVDMNTDRKTYLDVAQAAAAIGFTGIGHYNNFLHVGMGDQAAWGPDKTSATLAPDFKKAIETGWQEHANGVGDLMLQRYAQAKETKEQHEAALGNYNVLSGISAPKAPKVTADPVGLGATQNDLAKFNSQPLRLSDLQEFNRNGQGTVKTAGTEYVSPDGTTRFQAPMTPFVGPQDQPIPRPNAVGPEPDSTGSSMLDDILKAFPTTEMGDPTPTSAPVSSQTEAMLKTNMGIGKEASPQVTGPYSLNDPERARVIAQTILGEASGEGVEGMMAVANVIKNRALSGDYPPDPKDVALQANNNGIHQFSTWNSTSYGGNNPAQRYPEDSPEFKKALQIASAVFDGSVPDNTFGAVNYHASNITPYWADESDKFGPLNIGNHTFYPTSQPDSLAPLSVPKPASARSLNKTDSVPDMNIAKAPSPSTFQESSPKLDSDIRQGVQKTIAKSSSATANNTPYAPASGNDGGSTSSTYVNSSSGYNPTGNTSKPSSDKNTSSGGGFMSGPSSPAPKVTTSSPGSSGSGTKNSSSSSSSISNTSKSSKDKN